MRKIRPQACSGGDLGAADVVRGVLSSVLSVDICSDGVVRAVLWSVLSVDRPVFEAVRVVALDRRMVIATRRAARGRPGWGAGGSRPVNSGPCATTVGLPWRTPIVKTTACGGC